MGKAMSLIGTVYVGLLDGNKALVGGYRRLGNVYPVSIKLDTAQKKQISRLRESAGQNLHTKTSLADTIGAMVLREWDARNLAWALSGEEVELTATSGTVTTGSVTIVLDEWVKLGHKNVSSVVLGAHVLGTDYELNTTLGLVKGISTGGMTAEATSVDYAYAAESGYRVNIGTKTQIRIAMMIDGENEFDGEPVDAEFDSVVLATSADINLISDPETDYEELPFSLSYETLSGKSSPGHINGIPW